MKKRFLALVLVFALAFALIPADAPSAVAAEKSIWDKINDGDLLYGTVGWPFETDFTRVYTPEQSADIVSMIGVKCYRLGLNIPVLLTDSNELRQNEYQKAKEYINLLKEGGVDEIIVHVSGYYVITDKGVADSWAVSPPRRDVTKGSEYMKFLDMYSRSIETITAAFPEVKLWGFAGDWQGFYGYLPNEPATLEERAAVAADMMYCASKALYDVSPEAVSIMCGVDGSIQSNYIGSMTYYLTLIYEAIASGKSVGGSVKTDDYFQILSWNPYFWESGDAVFSPRMPDDEWLMNNNAMFNIAKKYGDGNKKVFFGEVGFCDFGDAGLEEKIAEYYKRLFNYVKQMDYVAHVSVFRPENDPVANWGYAEAERSFGLFKAPCEGAMPKKSAYAIQEIFGGSGDLLKYALTQSTFEFPYQQPGMYNWMNYNRDMLWRFPIPATAGIHAKKIIVVCDKAIIDSNYSFAVQSVDLTRFNKGDSRITVSGNTITLDLHGLGIARDVGFTVWDEDINSGIKGIYLDVAYDGTEAAYLPYIRAAASNALLPESQAGKFDEAITRADFDAFYVPLFQRKYGYDYDFTGEIDATFNNIKASGGFTRGDCVKAVVNLFEQWSGERSPNLPAVWAVDNVASAIAADLVPPQLQRQYTQTITRAEYCAMTVALYEKITKKAITERKSFPDDNGDVNIQKLYGLGIVSGSGGRFNPNGEFSRAEVAAMTAKLLAKLGKPLAASDSTFADNASIPAWALPAVGQVQAAGLMGGIGGNRFGPAVKYDRQSAMVLSKTLYEKYK